MSVNPADSIVYGGLFGTPEMRALFDERQRLKLMLDVEAALARVQAGAGLIPASAAGAITRAARLESLDIDTIGRSTATVGYPVVALVKALGAAAGPEAARWVHWGATTQDILDTATMLQVRDGLSLIEADLRRTLAGLAGLARRHRDTVMAGRSHLQHALPITFGYKCAIWMQPLLDSLDPIRELQGRVPVAQFAGAVGTLASLGAGGQGLASGLAAELGLGAPSAPWHVARGALAETVCQLGILCGGLAKIATDVILLMQTEVAEVSEPHQAGRGSSSTMPQKRNPIASEYILAAAHGVHALVPLMLGAMVHDHERATGPWQSEDLALPQTFVLTAGALANAVTLAEGLVVDEKRMAANLGMTQGLILAEAAMMALAPTLGRERAHDLVHEACDRVLAQGGTLTDALLQDQAVTDALPPERLRAALDPSAYLGQAQAVVDEALGAFERRTAQAAPSTR